MLSQRVFIFSICFLAIFAGSWADDDDIEKVIDATRGRIKEELQRLAELQSKIKQDDWNITVVFRHDEERDSFTLQSPRQATRDVTAKELSPNCFKKIFEFAENNNISAQISREIYNEDGSLYSKELFADDFESSFEEGCSSVIVRETYTEKADDEPDEYERFINMLKQYETPVDVHKTFFNEDGEFLREDSRSYKPTKVNIIDGDMPLDMQLEAAEALRKALALKENCAERIRVLSRYLGAQFRKTFHVVVGTGEHILEGDDYVRLELEGQIYHIISKY